MGTGQVVRLIHWDPREAEARASELTGAGYSVIAEPFEPASLRTLGNGAPDVILIDLTRRPSQGRDLGVLLRKRKSSRDIPLVFVGGERVKVDGVRALLPDAEYAPWSSVEAALKRALGRRKGEVVVPDSSFAAYAGTPLSKKLGIKPDSVVALIDAPEDFEDALGELPRDAVLRRGARGRCDLALWFVQSRSDLEARVVRLGSFAGADGLWIAWPKKASGVATDLSQTVVREVGLKSGLVDYKVCSIDGTWSGLKFTRRK